MSTLTQEEVISQRTIWEGKVRQAVKNGWSKDYDPDFRHDELEWGWLLPVLFKADSLMYGRWDYLTECWLIHETTGELPDKPIPQIDFVSGAQARRSPAYKMLEASLNCIPTWGDWQGWSSWRFVQYFLDWVLYGLGHSGTKELPKEPSDAKNASHRLYQVFCLEALQAWPYDYLGDMLAENQHGRHLGFYPTPMDVAQMMAQMTFGPTEGQKDLRLKTFYDCCTGTGRFPLVASNYTLRLHAQDIDMTVLKVATLNGYLYAPWLVKPIPSLRGNRVQVAAAMDEASAAQSARPDIGAYLANTEPDPELEWAFEPIRKLRRKDGSMAVVEQGKLF